MGAPESVYFDSAMADPVAAKAADGFEFGFSCDALGLARCASCGGDAAVLIYRFSEGDLRCSAVCQECGEAHLGYMQPSIFNYFGRYVAAHDWRGVLDVGFHRWQLGQGAKPIEVRSRQVTVAAGGLSSALGPFKNWLAARKRALS